MKLRNFFFLCAVSLVFAAVSPAPAQELVFDLPPPPQEPEPPPEAVPRQFRALELGMSLDDLRAALAQDGLFSFRGERDVSFLPMRQEALVETTGNSFIRRAHFQLAEGEVFIMSFSLDPRLVDHYSVFTRLVSRYGQPLTLNPLEAVWEDGYTRISIERPLTVKYVDRVVFDRLREEARTREAWDTMLREEFLAEF